APAPTPASCRDTARCCTGRWPARSRRHGPHRPVGRRRPGTPPAPSPACDQHADTRSDRRARPRPRAAGSATPPRPRRSPPPPAAGPAADPRARPAAPPRLNANRLSLVATPPRPDTGLHTLHWIRCLSSSRCAAILPRRSRAMPLMFQIRPPRNPLLRILMAVAGLFVLGMFTIVGVFVAALLLAAFAVRQLWLRANGRLAPG